MSQPDPPQAKKPRWAAVGVALFLIGLVIFVPLGLCTTLLALLLAPLDTSDKAWTWILAPVPLAIGAGLMYAGRKLRPRE